MEPMICSPTQHGQQHPIMLTVIAKSEQPQMKAFIEGDTVPVYLLQVRQQLTPVLYNQIPVISHADFVDMARETVHHIFRPEKITAPLIRVSHLCMQQQKGTH